MNQKPKNTLFIVLSIICFIIFLVLAIIFNVFSSAANYAKNENKKTETVKLNDFKKNKNHDPLITPAWEVNKTPR